MNLVFLIIHTSDYVIIVFINFLSLKFIKHSKLSIEYTRKSRITLKQVWRHIICCVFKLVFFFIIYTIFIYIRMMIQTIWKIHVWMSLSLIVIEWATQISSIMEYVLLVYTHTDKNINIFMNKNRNEDKIPFCGRMNDGNFHKYLSKDEIFFFTYNVKSQNDRMNFVT